MARQNLKLELISVLLKHGFNLDDVLTLTTNEALTNKGVKVGKKEFPLDDEEVKLLGQYVQKNKDKIKKFLFPSLNGQQLTRQNFLIGFKKFIKGRGETLADYGIVSTRGARKPKVELNNMQAILDFLK